ncbi:SpaH/EbpB family LPXTG-anchored major pilin (plasmid) [Lactococcus garvieae]|uniref:SpaH/EbpB family LPXTG-anchored major pilin n=1 Tax=Lactococcus garvieae TaxID=1363 RepID=UPI0030CCBCD2
MKMKKIVSGLMMSTIALGGLAAVTPVGQVLFGENNIVYADSPIADDTSQRTVTLTKYAITSQDQLGAPGDGTAWNNPNGLATLKGVHFQLIKVNPLGGSVLTDASTAVEGTDYELSTDPADTHDAYTDDKGQITFDLGTGKANDGIYILKEIKQAGGEVIENNDTGKETAVKYMANPSFIQVPMTNRTTQSGLIYDINVYPKNQEETPLDPQKTIDGQGVASIVPGNPFTWEAAFKINPSEFSYVASEDSNIPGLDPNQPYTGPGSTGGHVTAGQTVYMDYLRVSDDLDPKLDLTSVEMQVKDSSGAWVTLDQGVDYDFETGANTMTPAGLNVVELTQEGMEKVGQMAGATEMRVVYHTVINSADFDGTIKNEFTVDKDLPGLNPDTGTNPEIPVLPLGGFDILKTGEDTQAALQGAEFMLATSEQNARDGIYLASDGKSYDAASLPSGVTFIEETSDVDGKIHFTGLELMFTDGNGNDYLDFLPDGVTVDPASGDTIQKDYWAVETKAPDGYELLKDPQKITIDLTTGDTSSIELEVEDKVQTQLPFTGGEASTLMIVIALGTIGIGTTMVVMNKKRNQSKTTK